MIQRAGTQLWADVRWRGGWRIQSHWAFPISRLLAPDGHLKCRGSCNVASDSVSDREFFSDFVDFVAENEKLASQLVFEFRQRDLEQADESLLEKLRRLSALGFRFSLDGVRHINFDLAALARDQVKFIKIDAHRILEHVEIDGGVADIQNLKRALDRAGIDLIVEKIETEKQLVELLDFNIDYGEGFLLGEPRRSQDA